MKSSFHQTAIIKTTSWIILIGGLTVACRGKETILLNQIGPAQKQFTGSQFPSFMEEPRLAQTIALGEVTLPAFTPPFPSRTTFTVVVPANAFLEFSVAVVSPKPVKKPRVEFSVDIEIEGQRANLYREAIRAAEINSWYRRRTNLGAWSGKRVNLVFETRPALGQRRVPWAGRILTAWGKPVLKSEARPTRFSSEPPSFVFLLQDTLRADYLGAYGFDGDISPALDRLALESVLFENCFTNAPWTKPAVASLFTSLYPEVHGVVHIGQKSWIGSEKEDLAEVLPEQAFTLAESLGKNGYRTAAFIANPWVSPRHGFSQGFDIFKQRQETRDLLEAAKTWLNGLPDESPFFLYLHFMDVHGPYEAPRRDYDALLDSSSLGEPHTLDEEEYNSIPAYLKKTTWASDEERLDVRAWRAKYAAGVRSFDHQIRPFLDDLRNDGTLDHTYVIFTSDHGEELLDHGHWDHGHNLLEHQLHIPLLMRRPLAENAGRRLKDMISLVDLMPTVLSLAGISSPPGLQGRDFKELLGSAGPAGTASVFSSAVKKNPNIHAVRTAQNKLVWDTSADESYLFDLVSDPGEHTNVVSRDRYLTERLRRQLLRHLADMEAREALSVETTPMPETLRERLKSLGYVH